MEFLKFTTKLDPLDWSGISAITNILMLLLNFILLFSVFLAIKSLKEAVKMRNVEILKWACLEMEKVKDELEVLKQAPKYSEGWTDETDRAAKKMSSSLQRMAYFALHRLIDEEHLINMWGYTFTGSWENLKPWVKDLRKKNGEPEEIEYGAFSRRDFEVFAEKCQAELSKRKKEFEKNIKKH